MFARAYRRDRRPGVAQGGGTGPRAGRTARLPHVDRDFGLSEDERDLVKMVREWADERAAPSAASYEEKKEFPRELFAQLGEMGLGGIPYDERYGGGGQSFLAYLAVVEEVARAYLSLGIGVSVHHL